MILISLPAFFNEFVNCRRQRTAEEANKLCQVQNELKKMDFSVAQEVKTLRKTIEEASLGFLQAQ